MLALFLAIITTTLGQIEGVERSQVDAYLGIPYAEPPMGERLYRAPEPIHAWGGVLDATHGECNCIQEASTFSAKYLSRNCLYLNVYVPHHPSGEKLPVVVWYHGGSWATGGTGSDSDSTLRHDMSEFAHRVHAIVVTVNYRLNVFGFLYLTHLDASLDANCGLRDQLMGLEWVNHHIAAFDGDEHNITLMGQSAGAGSIMAIMSIAEANPLYQRVLLMSPPPTSFLTQQEAIKRTRRYLRLVSLDEMTDERICQANPKFMKQIVFSGDQRCAFSPVVDGQLLTAKPMQGALQCHKPMLIGYVSHETELFAVDIPKALLPLVKPLFPSMSRKMFFVPIDTFYNAYQGPKQKYYYDYTTPQMDSLGLHCCHSYEMPVIFGWKTPLCDPNDPRTRQVGDSVCTEWKKFIYGK